MGKDNGEEEYAMSNLNGERRSQVLQAIYKCTNGNLETVIGKADITQIVGFQGEELINALQFLENEEFIESLSPLLGDLAGITITNRGIKKAEAMYLDLENLSGDERKEYLVLKCLSDRSNPAERRGIESKEVASHTGLSEKEVESILNNLLYSAKLIDHPTLNSGFTIKDSGIQKLREFARQLKQPNSQVSVNIGNNYAPVIAAHNASNNNLENKINNSFNNSDILQEIVELRQQINTLSQENQDVAAEALDTLESEITTPTKPAKLKVALFSLWGIAQGVATFANAVTAIAERFGVKFN